jgi:hypothetical protein
MKYKKKSKSQVALLPDSSIMKEAVEVIKALPDPVKQENEQLQEYITMFKRLRYMARTLEKRFKENPSSQTVYALMKIYDQVREVIADMRALRDVQQMGETLNREVLTPYTRSVAAALAAIHQNLKADIKNNVPEEYIGQIMSIVNQHVAKAASDVNNTYNNALMKTVEVFGGG